MKTFLNQKALSEAGLSYTEGTLEQFELANKPGALAELAGKLAKKGINIDSAYATMPKGAKKA
ncbi:MAG: ACT domain-containing protein, partial [Terriglobales bacterium]